MVDFIKNFEKDISHVHHTNFDERALALFHFQSKNNKIYKQYIDYLKIDTNRVTSIDKIPFLPIQFFKKFDIKTTDFTPQITFSSSTTTNTGPSFHHLKSVKLYQNTFLQGFNQFYGSPADYCILALLPSYLERSGSSLVYMFDLLIENTEHPLSGFYLQDTKKLIETIHLSLQNNQKTLLLGVTYALLDLIEQHQHVLLNQNFIVMETGGMKGRRQELIRPDVHNRLCKGFGVPQIHSEYGMTELLSQAYSAGKGLFKCTNTLKILIRETTDARTVFCPSGNVPRSGAINAIDLANLHSCAFVETQDLGKRYPDGTFEVLGRMDNSDIRGCNLMLS